MREDIEPGSEIDIIGLEDRDEIQNKDPTFTLQHKYDGLFNITLNKEKDGILRLKEVRI